jgi:hypothetical protein
MKQEFKLLAAIIRDNTPESYDYDPEVGNKSAKKADYDLVEVIPVSDPNASTMSQRVVQYQAVLQLSQTAPQIYDLPFLHRQMIETLGVKNVAKIVPMADDMKPIDPVSENMHVLMGKPVKAFIGQDHDAHLAVHTMMLQDPKLAATLGQNPQAQALIAAAQAHIMEHTAFQYRANIEKMLGTTLPAMPKDDEEVTPLAPEMEAQIAQLSAQAAAKLLQKDQAEAQQQQAQQQAQDPLLQMQQQELQIKQSEVQRKQQKDQVDAQLRAKELEIRQTESEARTELEGAKLGISTQHDRATLLAQQMNNALQHGNTALQQRNDMAKHQANLGHQTFKHLNPAAQNSPNPGAGRKKED